MNTRKLKLLALVTSLTSSLLFAACAVEEGEQQDESQVTGGDEQHEEELHTLLATTATTEAEADGESIAELAQNAGEGKIALVSSDIGKEGVSAAANCRIRVGNHNGLYICGTRVGVWTHPDGRLEWFVVGADRAIWHIWQRTVGDTAYSGWRTLGGYAQDLTGLRRPRVYVRGGDGRPWCRDWPWRSGWFRCG